MVADPKNVTVNDLLGGDCFPSEIPEGDHV